MYQVTDKRSSRKFEDAESEEESVICRLREGGVFWSI
jgi:hypothetical protein